MRAPSCARRRARFDPPRRRSAARGCRQTAKARARGLSFQVAQREPVNLDRMPTDLGHQPPVPPPGPAPMHIDVSNVQVTASQASRPDPSPSASQSKPCRSDPSHCSPGAISPSPQSPGRTPSSEPTPTVDSPLAASSPEESAAPLVVTLGGVLAVSAAAVPLTAPLAEMPSVPAVLPDEPVAAVSPLEPDAAGSSVPQAKTTRSKLSPKRCITRQSWHSFPWKLISSHCGGGRVLTLVPNGPALWERGQQATQGEAGGL